MGVPVNRSEPIDFAPRLRALVGEIDPEIVLTGVRPLDESAWEMTMSYSAWFWIVFGMGGMGILLATVGIYSIMSFTVSRRTREIE